MSIRPRILATIVEKHSSYSFALNTATGAAPGSAAGIASGIASGNGSGSATARENNIMATALMTLKGIMTALVEDDEVCEWYDLV